MKFSAVIAIALPLFLESVSASLNCTVVNPVDYHLCEYETCPVVGTYEVGDMIMAACRSDCSSMTDVWFKLYNGHFLSAANVTDCEYHGTKLQPTILPYCYEESMIPKPATCTSFTVTPTPTTPPMVTPKPKMRM